MVKPKRMSDIFASSAEKAPCAISTIGTPPYCSEGPTLPIIGGEGGDIGHGGATVSIIQYKTDESTRKKRKTQAFSQGGIVTMQTQPFATIHSSLYEPWSLLPQDLLKSLNSQARLRGNANIVPIVFTKNQNLKAGINRLKTYLGAYDDKEHPTEMPEALKQADVIISVSAQGEGTTKLVSIVDVAKRVVAPSTKEPENAVGIETWWSYSSLTSIDVEKTFKAVPKPKAKAQLSQTTESTEEEEEAFEPMEVDPPVQERTQESKQMRKAPVLTIWMTKKRIPAFKEAFGEQTFTVQLLSQNEE
jgi:hypothetical protein